MLVDADFHLVRSTVDQISSACQTVLQLNNIDERTSGNGNRFHGEALAAVLRPGSGSTLRLNESTDAGELHIKFGLVAEANTLGVSNQIQPVGIVLHDIIHSEFHQLRNLILVIRTRIRSQIFNQFVRVLAHFAVDFLVTSGSSGNFYDIGILINLDSHYFSPLIIRNSS